MSDIERKWGDTVRNGAVLGILVLAQFGLDWLGRQPVIETGDMASGGVQPNDDEEELPDPAKFIARLEDGGFDQWRAGLTED